MSDQRIKQRIAHDPAVGDYHELWLPAGYATDRKAVETLDARGRAHRYSCHKWLRVMCNNGDCPAVFLVREDAITDMVAAAFPAHDAAAVSP